MVIILTNKFFSSECKTIDLALKFPFFFKLTLYFNKNTEKNICCISGIQLFFFIILLGTVAAQTGKGFPIMDININLKQIYPGYQYQPELDISWISISTLNRFILDININLKQIYLGYQYQP